jgi:3-hydroxyacyl-[acyl-carrier-protein] dehydratase
MSEPKVGPEVVMEATPESGTEATPPGVGSETIPETMPASMPKPEDVLPHRSPFLLLTNIVSCQPGLRVHAQWQLSGQEMFWPGHFPGRPTLPGVLMIESLAQAGAVAVLMDERFAGKLPLFGGVDSSRFRRQVLPGDTLDLHVEMTRLSGRGGKGTGIASVNGEKACEAELLFVLADL